MIDSDAVAVSFAAKVHPWLAYVVTIGVCLSLIGSINITFLAAGRMPFVAGRMGFMPEVYDRNICSFVILFCPGSKLLLNS